MALQIPWKLLRNYVQGNIIESELRELEYWRTTSEINMQIYDEVIADEIFRNDLIAGRWENVTNDWEKILARIKPVNKIIRFQKKVFYLAGSAAAILLLLIGLSVGFLYEKIQKDEIQLREEYSYVYSPRGQRTQVVLPDRTKVWLNSESSLKYSSNFNKQSREVYLEGEGYFEVSKNPHKLFFVNAGEIKAKVYGTSFNIKAFPGENTIETTLIEGKLSVIPTKLRGKSDKEILLKPNEKCIYTKVDTKGKPGSETIELSIASHNDSPDSIILPFKDIPNIILEKKPYLEPERSWKDGKLVFKNETFGELEIRLERWYNVYIHFENEDIKNYRFTGSFEKETINQAMEALRLSSQESYQCRIEYRDIYLK